MLYTYDESKLMLQNAYLTQIGRLAEGTSPKKEDIESCQKLGCMFLQKQMEMMTKRQQIAALSSVLQRLHEELKSDAGYVAAVFVDLGVTGCSTANNMEYLEALKDKNEILLEAYKEFL